MGCMDVCEKLYSKITFDLGHLDDTRKYCGRCEICYTCDEVSCARCGVALRKLPTCRKEKKKLRLIRQKREEQDRIIRIIKGGN